MEVQTSAATHKGIGLKSLYFGLVTILAAVISYVMFYKFLDTGNGEALYVLLMIGSILVNHFIARRIQRFHSIEKASGIDCSFERKAWLVAALVLDFFGVPPS